LSFGLPALLLQHCAQQAPDLRRSVVLGENSANKVFCFLQLPIIDQHLSQAIPNLELSWSQFVGPPAYCNRSRQFAGGVQRSPGCQPRLNALWVFAQDTL